MFVQFAVVVVDPKEKKLGVNKTIMLRKENQITIGVIHKFQLIFLKTSYFKTQVIPLLNKLEVTEKDDGVTCKQKEALKLRFAGNNKKSKAKPMVLKKINKEYKTLWKTHPFEWHRKTCLPKFLKK